MSDLSDVLATIDGALADYSMSPDAMRWTDEPPTPPPPMIEGVAGVTVHVDPAGLWHLGPITWITQDDDGRRFVQVTNP